MPRYNPAVFVLNKTGSPLANPHSVHGVRRGHGEFPAVRTILTRTRAAAALALCALWVAPTTALADDDRGRELFELCAQCHGHDGGGMQYALAPAIAGVEQWYLENQLKLFRDGIRGMHPDDIAGMRMSPMARSTATGMGLVFNIPIYHLIISYLITAP